MQTTANREDWNLLFHLTIIMKWMKKEMYYGMTYYSYEELKIAIEKYIKYYNEQTIKEKLGWMSPIEYRLNLLAA